MDSLPVRNAGILVFSTHKFSIAVFIVSVFAPGTKIVFACSVVSVAGVPASSGYSKFCTFPYCVVSISWIFLFGAWLRTVAALPIPTFCHHSPNGKIGSVLKTLAPNFSIGAPIAFPSAFALIAAKRIVRRSPIAKKFTISHENRSSEPHRSKFLNSNSEEPATLKA